MQTLSIDAIYSDPNVRGGRPCIVGTGLRVTDIVIAHLFHEQTPDEIAAGFDISLSDVYAALSYYYDHKDELDDDIREQIRIARELKEKRVGSTPPFLFG